MTLEQQIDQCCRQVLARINASNPQSTEDWEALCVASYLSGCSQTASFLMANDGEVTPHQILNAVKIVGARAGLDFGSPNPS